MSASKEFNKARAAFMRRASAPELPASALKLAYIIAYKEMDVETQSTFRSQKALATALNAKERNVRKLLRVLQPFGLVIEPGHGPGSASIYRIEAVPEPVPEAEKRHSSAGIRKTKAALWGTKTGTLGHQKRHSSAAPLNKTLQEESPREDSDSQPADFFDDVKKAIRREDFEEFWRAYPKRVAKEAARRAFAAAMKRGLDPAVLIAGAERYAVERAGQEARFTKHPATWLNAGCWEDEPPGAPVIDQHGRAVAVRETQRDLVQDYIDSLPDEGWEVPSWPRH
jgi:hypothetical protein